MKKRILAALLVFIIACAPVYAAESSGGNNEWKKNVENVETIYNDKKTIPTWFFTELKSMQNATATISNKTYSLSFNSATVGEFDTRLDRYNFNMERQYENLEDYNAAVGEKTPKYVLKFPSNGTGNTTLPAATTVTMYDASFAPYSELFVYRVLGNQKYEPIEKSIIVDKDANFSFTITEYGTYLVSSTEIANRINTFLDRDYPELTPVDELLAEYSEESRYDFSSLITRTKIG